MNIDKNLCTGCAKCAKDCMVKAIEFDKEEKVPRFAVDGTETCIHCQHCVAICPTGALSIDGVTAADCPEAGELPEVEKMENLIRQRRSIRRFTDEELPEETLYRLKNVLHWTPTGCNNHGLQFFIAGKEDVAQFKAVSDRWVRFLIKSGIMGLLLPRYRRYFKDVLAGADVIYRKAPHLIIVMAPKNAPCCKTDQVIALTQFDMFAQSLGVGTCWCGFAEYAFRLIPQLRKMIGCPKNYVVGGAMLFGKASFEYQRATMPSKFVIRNSVNEKI
jgi:nitroreductase/NAD-dependent dihydropyrimidine dehydrogenase PreA subunit